LNDDRDPTPDRRELRTFGLTTGGIVAVLFAAAATVAAFACVPGLAMGGGRCTGYLGLVVPAALVRIYTLWMKFGHVIGAIQHRPSRPVFYVVVTPSDSSCDFSAGIRCGGPAKGGSTRDNVHQHPQHMEETILMIDLPRTSGPLMTKRKKFWLAPISSRALLFGALIVLGQGSAGGAVSSTPLF